MSTPTHFKVSGTKILDPMGKEFLLKGTNVNGPGWVFQRDTLQDLELIVDVWKFNSVRVCATIGWEWCREANMDLDALVEAFTSRGIVFMLEIHDYTGSYPPLDEKGHRDPGSEAKYVYPLSTLAEWWVDIANRYKDNPYVWFNIMNEPGSTYDQQSFNLWSLTHETVIEAIRATGAENIIVLDDHGWGQAGGYYDGASSYDSAIIAEGPKLQQKYDNLVFSLHVYEAWRDGYNRFNNYFRDAHRRGLCVILGEYGAMPGNPAFLNPVKSMFDSALENNIGRMSWAWDSAGMPMTTEGCGWAVDKTDGTKPGNLSWLGELIWMDNHGQLTSPVPNYPANPLSFHINFDDAPSTSWMHNTPKIQKGASRDGSNAMVVEKEWGGHCSLDLLPATQYQLSAWGRNANATDKASVIILRYKTAADSKKAESVKLEFTDTEWTRNVASFTTPEHVYGPTLNIVKPDADNIFYLDDIWVCSPTK